MSTYPYNNLVNYLRSLLGVLELDKNSQLYQDTVAICNYLENPNYQIAVCGPFNHGKSTLLNALLGNKTLPIDLIPTTGAAIYVGYGEELQTVISLKDGREIKEKGTDILKQYAILNSDRRMQENVAEVRVFCNHPFLKTGVEFLDLPGTNDQELQNDLVKDKLLGADLIIHVLDARKLMTLEERENLRDWLENRGITRVAFVVNFLNLLTTESQKKVQNRLCFIAESFRSNLPTGISNLYCVDALPALRARLKGDTAAAQTTGLAGFESALQNLVNSQQKKQFKLSRVLNIADQILQVVTAKQQALTIVIKTEQDKQAKQIAIKQKAAKLIGQSFTRSVSDFQGWLYLPKLLSNYQAQCAISLQQGKFVEWQQGEFSQTVLNYQQAINQWVEKGCEFFQHDGYEPLLISFPDLPTVKMPESIPDTSKSKDAISPELNSLLKGQVGSIILGGASYVLNKVAPKSESEKSTQSPPPKIASQVYADSAKNYLTCFCDRASAILKEYEMIAVKYISFIPEPTSNQTPVTNYQLQLLNSLLTSLQSELNIIK